MAETLQPNIVGGLDDPVNIAILDTDGYVHDHQVLPVTSGLIMEPSTNIFNKDGFYSELIFGEVGSPDRMLQFGYIDLHTPVFHPKIFKITGQLGKLYHDIISGKAYATFDPVTKDFVRVTGNPHDDPESGTGFSFFIQHFADIQFRKRSSSRRDDRIAVIEQYKSRTLMVKHLVEPAGLRDISTDSTGRLIQDEVNSLYSSLLMYTRSIPIGSKSVLYDSVRYQIQTKVQQIYEYLENFLDGKYGFIQGSFARRKIAQSTRNVITAAPFHAASPTDPQLMKSDDVMVGVFQTAKGLQTFTKHVLSTIFATPIFRTDATRQITLSDLKTKQLVYTQVSSTIRDMWTSTDGLDKLINSFKNTELRSMPILIPDVDGQNYALLFVYDEGDTIALCRSIDDLKSAWPRPVHPDKLRPITYIELFYLITETVSQGKHCIVTRYPVIEQGSCYVGRIHVVSTTPSRVVQMVDLLQPDHVQTTLKQYPVIGSPCMDAMMVHPSRLGQLGGDHDGDKVSCEYVMADDSNEECAAYLESPRSVLNTDLRFITGGSTYLIDLTLHALTHD